MKQVDMSPEAITERLKLMSHLLDFCLALGRGRIIRQEAEKSRPSSERLKELEDESG